jgi:hypothetical protein
MKKEKLNKNTIKNGKVIYNGMIAVLYSPGFGAGWSTWSAPKELIFDPEIVELVEKNQHFKIEEMLKNRGYDFYMGGADQLKIEWMPEGTLFRIKEYDGNESIEYSNDTDFIIA